MEKHFAKSNSLWRLACCLLFAFTSIQSTIHAQQEQQVKNQLDSLARLFEAGQQKLKWLEESDSNTFVISSLSQLSESRLPLYAADSFYARYAAYLKKDLGLQLGFDALENFNVSQKDVEDNILYKRRFQSGLEWNMGKGGYLENRRELEMIPVRLELERQMQALKQNRPQTAIKMNQCIAWFNRHKMEILSQRQQLLSSQYHFLEQFYFAKKVSREAVIKAQTRLAEVKAMKNIYGSYEDVWQVSDTAILAAGAPLFDLRYDKIIALSGSEKHSDSLSMWYRNQLQARYRWYNEIKLKSFVRYNFYDLLTTNPSNRSFFNAGISAGIPLPFNQRENLHWEEEKLNRQLQTWEEAAENKRIEILNLAYEFRYQLKQYILFHQKLILNKEAIRQERVKAKLLDADFNPLHGLDLLDDQQQIQIELLDLKQGLYIKLLKIHEKMGPMPIEDLLEPVQLPEYLELESNDHRSCYIWSKVFEEQDVSFLAEYLIYNQFEEVQLAISQNDPQLEKKKALIGLLNVRGIRVKLMIGNNSLMDDPQAAETILKTCKAYSDLQIDGLHLDIEPHTRPDWKTNREELSSKLLNILTETKSLVSSYNWKLTMDLPATTDSLLAQSALTLCDGVHVMCYENIKTEYLERKLKPYQPYAGKVVIALRTEDFADRQTMEAFASEMMSKTGINKVALHDLRRLIELDKKALNPDEKH